MSDRLITRARVSRRFTRAIRVDADLDALALDGYVCSQSATEALLLMARHQRATSHGAFTWTGPYGSGKSSLALALVALAAGTPEQAKGLLKEIGGRDAATLEKAFRPTNQTWIVAPVVGRREDPELVIGAALADAVRGRKGMGRKPDERLAAWALRISATSERGLLLIVDEMGKFLENAARGGGDVYLFQELAEMSARSKGRLLVVGILHQAFDEYAHRLAREARDEWLKVQGRYLDVPVNLASEEQLELIGRAITGEKPGAVSEAGAVAAALQLARFGDPELLGRRLTACWPLHPIVAALLGPISRRRFGQNQRSLFGFLNSAEPYGFQAYLQEAPAKDPSLYPVARLWDYLHANLEPAILASPDGHRWSTALEAVGRAESKGATADHLSLLKAITLIDLFKDRSGLHATPEVLACVLGPGVESEDLLEDLKRWSVVIYRNHTGAYAIYAGSDFDIEVAVLEARRAGAGVNYRQLSRQAGLQPVLAKRHYEDTGALRWFEVELAPVHEIEDRVRTYKAAPGAAGLFLLAVSAQGEERAEAKAALARAMALADERLVVCGWSRDSYMIREMAADVAALEHVRASRPELEGDAIARREVDARLARLSADLEDRLSEAINAVDWTLPEASPKDLAVNVSGPAGLTILASRLADWRYPQAPRLPNELVNRTKPSSNAAAATRQLLWAMVERPDLERLGFENYPPELGLYVSLLETTGLHMKAKGEARWRFATPPPGGKSRLDGLWSMTDEMLDTKIDGLQVTHLFDAWRAPPFGLRDGLLPILLMAYLLTRAGRTAIYLDGKFRPTLDKFVVDRLLQEPASLKIKTVELTEVDVAFIAAMSETLSAGREIVPPTPLDVAKTLFADIKNLPPWTLRTAHLGDRAKHLRDRVRPSDDPNQMLLEDVPAAMGCTAGEISGVALARRVSGAVSELQNAYPAMLADLQATLLRELRVKTAGDEDYGSLRRRSQNVRGLTGNFRLDALATRLSTFSGSLEEIEGIASLAANKPPRDWVDRNVLEARIELAALAQQFLKAESFARVDKRPDGRVAVAVYISDPDLPEPQAQEIELSASDRAIADALALELAALLDGRGASHEVAVATVASLGLRLAANRRDAEPTTARAG